VAASVELRERGSLHRTSGSGLHLDEKGTATGTIRGTVYIHLRVGLRQTFMAEVNVYPRAGSLSGTGSGHYRFIGGNARFSGTLSITRGTGRYAHARAHGLRFTGSIQRSNYAVTVALSGTLRY
jgi:hypothetical protein